MPRLVAEPVGYGLAAVTLDGWPLAREPAHVDGWDWIDAETVRLYGPACANASAHGAELSIAFVCKATSGR